MNAALLPLLCSALLAGHAGGHASGHAGRAGRGVLPPGAARPQAMALHIDKPPAINGRLDEPEWSQATPIGRLLQEEPEEGVAATEETDVRILYDSNNLYIGVRCYDRE